MDGKRCIFVFLIHDSRIEIFVILHNTNAKGKLRRAKGENMRVKLLLFYLRTIGRTYTIWYLFVIVWKAERVSRR